LWLGRLSAQLRKIEFFSKLKGLTLHNLKILILILGFSMLNQGCTDNKGDPNDPQAAYLAAREPYEEGNYEIALTKLKEFTARFPYSNLTAKAELEIADSHFRLEQFPEASAVYAEFMKLHPKHEEVHFAKFRMGLCQWNLAPESIDRDQEFTEKAVFEFKELMQNYPNSKFVAEAKANVEKGERRLAEALAFTGVFYCKQEIWHACAQRSMELVDEWPQYKDLVKEAARRVARSFERLADLKDKDADSDKNQFFKKMTAEEMRKKARFFEASAEKIQDL
jgi:outer membrane protein assembly factor BamD